MKKLLFTVAVIATLAATAKFAFADRGAVPLGRNAILSVPRQQAIIAWNGKEETLILGTDRRASREVKVLEVLPLPSEPTIWKPKEEVFDLARTTIAAKLAKPKAPVALGYAGSGMRDGKAAAGEVTKHRKIGQHDIRVVEVKDSAEFATWARDNLKKWGAQIPDLPAPFRYVINQYIREGYKWFAFDIVELGPETGTLDPVGYRFHSDHLYFPLRVSTLDSGDSFVELIVLSDQELSRPDTVGQATLKANYMAADLSASEQGKIDGHISGMFPGRGKAFAQTWEIAAKTVAFTSDLRVTAVAKR